MMTSGLVVMLEPDSRGVEQALAAIGGVHAFLVGRRNGCWLPIAVEAADRAACERWHEWLSELPGVAGVEVVFVQWDETEEAHVGA